MGSRKTSADWNPNVLHPRGELRQHVFRPMVAGGADDDQLRSGNSGLFESLQQVIRSLARIDGEYRQHAKCVVGLRHGMKVIQIDSRKHHFDLFGWNASLHKRLFRQIGNRVDARSAFDFTRRATLHRGMNETRRWYAQPPMLLLQQPGNVFDVGVQRGQNQRDALAAQEFKGLAALSHHAIEQLHSRNQIANVGIEVDIAEQRQKILPAAQQRARVEWPGNTRRASLQKEHRCKRRDGPGHGGSAPGHAEADRAHTSPGADTRLDRRGP